jgi:NAD(P)-dependent dehydrogenase (short-subunit alcohol dehydrogenase family)
MSLILPQAPSLRIDGRRALVTGAGRGIGLAAAAALAQSGGHVTLVARTRAEIEEGAQAIVEAGGQATWVCLDVLDLPAVSAFFDGQSAFHILVNNAGTNRPKPVTQVSEDDFDAVLNLNLKAAYFVAQGAIMAMLREGIAGSLIHISSQMGHVGGVNRSLYCASKWAVEGMSKAIALDVAQFGIRSNTIAPTFIETPMTAPFLADAQFKSAVVSKIKLGRLGQVEDIMGGVQYLASDASALVTGTSLIVDGGWTAD